jgi:glycosyltransferase involved in cell wall biosynthesis
MVGLNRLNDECDLYWFPQYNAPWDMPWPSVVTVHDLIQLRYNQLAFPNWKVAAAKSILRRTLKKARLIVCVSEATKTDLLEENAGLEDKIRVVYNGVSSRWQSPSIRGVRRVNEELGSTPFLLSVSQKKPHKNQKLLLELIDRLHGQGYPHKLVLVGRNTSQWKETFREWSRGTKALDQVIDLGEIDDELLGGLYSKASLFLLPSLYEGFGLTVLEAMAAGTPTVVSNRGALPDTVGKAGLLLDPLDLDSWEEEVVKLLNSTSESSRLSQLGREHASERSWEAKTSQLVKVFEEALQT